MRHRDLSGLNELLLEQFGGSAVDGILGADVLNAHLGVIDAKLGEMYLLRRGD